MRFEKYINEKFFDSFMYQRIHMVDIFVNPSKRELRELYNSFRDQSYGSVGFICDLMDDKIYFFSRKHIIHQDAWNHINKGGPKLYHDSRYLTGELTLGSKGKVQGMNFDSFSGFSTTDVKREALDSDWSYFDKWIPNINDELHKFFKLQMRSLFPERKLA